VVPLPGGTRQNSSPSSLLHLNLCQNDPFPRDPKTSLQYILVGSPGSKGSTPTSIAGQQEGIISPFSRSSNAQPIEACPSPEERRPAEMPVQPLPFSDSGNDFSISVAQSKPEAGPAGDASMSQRERESCDGLIQSDLKRWKQNFRRTKTGCFTCRERRKKCDEAKPQCESFPR